MQLVACEKIDKEDTPTGIGIDAGVFPSVAAFSVGNYDLLLAATKGFALYDNLCLTFEGLVFSFEDYVNTMFSMSVSEFLEVCEFEEISVEEFVNLV